MLRAQLWTVALSVALLCSVGWLFLPGECVVRPLGTSGFFLNTAIIATFFHPFSVDEIYLLYVFLKISPVLVVILAILHWRNRFGKLRAVTAFYALVLSSAVAFAPYRTFSDVELIAIVGIWGVVVLLAYQSKASPGSAMLSLMSIQLLMSEIYSGLGPDRGLPFWALTVCLSIIFSYGVFHYTRMLRHSVLGRFTQVRQLDPEEVARRKAYAEQQRRLEGQSPS